MTACKRGDVVLVGFVLSDESGEKLRPTVVVSSPEYHRSRQEVIVMAVTGKTARRPYGAHLLSEWKKAGLLSPSLATGILRTIQQTMIRRKLGTLSKSDMDAVDRSLGRTLGL